MLVGLTLWKEVGGRGRRGAVGSSGHWKESKDICDKYSSDEVK